MTIITTTNFRRLELSRELSRIVGFSCLVLLILASVSRTTSAQAFEWPEGKKMAISLSFDDARKSQPNGGAEFLTQHGIKATFYALPGPVEEDLESWRKIVADGHEIGNHTLLHPCTGNFDWTGGNELEDYDLDKMRKEIIEANDQLEKLLGVRPVSFAYTCGESYVGRGQDTKSMVPLIDELFVSGRDWRNEMTNDPSHVDLAQVRGTEMDGIDFEEIRALLETAKEQGSWVALAGHEINESGMQTVRFDFLKELFVHVEQDPEIWLTTDGEVAAYIQSIRDK